MKGTDAAALMDSLELPADAMIETCQKRVEGGDEGFLDRFREQV